MTQLQSMFTKAVATVRPTETIARAAELIERHNVGAIVVTEQERPVGKRGAAYAGAPLLSFCVLLVAD